MNCLLALLAAPPSTWSVHCLPVLGCRRLPPIALLSSGTNVSWVQRGCHMATTLRDRLAFSPLLPIHHPAPGNSSARTRLHLWLAYSHSTPYLCHNRSASRKSKPPTCLCTPQCAHDDFNASLYRFRCSASRAPSE